MKFILPKISIHYTAGRLSVGRPAPPAPVKAPTLSELIVERSKLATILGDKRIDSAMYPPGLTEKIAALDTKIQLLAGAR